MISTSTPVKWKKNTNLDKKHNRHGNLKRKRGLEEHSFFVWFSDNNNPAHDDIVQTIREDLWHNALQYYLTPSFEDEDEELL